MDFGMILDILILGSGIYMVYWSIQMKQTHKIPEMLVGKGFPISRAKDPDGFIKATFPWTFGTGAIIFCIGVLGALEVFILYPVIDFLISLVIVVVVVVYGKFLLKAQRKYLIGLETEENKKKKRR